MEELFNFFYKKLQETDLSFQRYLINEIDWNGRLSAITGARGTGKTTMILQHIKKEFGDSPVEALYVSLDHFWFSENRLFDLATSFDKLGGKFLFIDEVYKYENWSREIRSISDCFSNMKIVFIAPSTLEIHKSNADLSRRATHYVLHGMSFREFLKFDQDIDFERYTLDDVLLNHIRIAGDINEKITPISLFGTYLKQGYYPYCKSDKQLFLSKLANMVNLILETDLPAVGKIEIHSIKKIKKLFWIIFHSVPFTPNVAELATSLGDSRNSLLNYLKTLERVGLINFLQSCGKKTCSFAKPEKVYLNNTNLAYALESKKSDRGNLQETFFFNQLRAVSEVTLANYTNFTVNEKYTFKVGSQSKKDKKIIGAENSYFAVDNIECGFENNIPLWLFGMLY